MVISFYCRHMIPGTSVDYKNKLCVSDNLSSKGINITLPVEVIFGYSKCLFYNSYHIELSLCNRKCFKMHNPCQINIADSTINLYFQGHFSCTNYNIYNILLYKILCLVTALNFLHYNEVNIQLHSMSILN